MALQVANRVKEITSTTGTGAVTLGGAVRSYQAFGDVLADTDTCYYAIENGTDWEVGLGTYAAGGNTLARTTVLASSNADALVNWTGGDKYIYLTLPATEITNFRNKLDASEKGAVSGVATLDGGGTLTASEIPSGVTLNADADVSGNSWVIDEDTMVSNLATKVPTQQSVKAYVDSVGGGSGDMAAATYDPAIISEQLVGLTATQTLTNKTLTQPTVTLKQGTAPTPTAEGDIQWDTDDNTLKIGDGTSAKVFSSDADISITEAQISDLTHDIAAATTTAPGKVELATNTETTAGTDTDRATTPAGVKAVADLKQNILTEGAFIDGDKTKLDGIEASADVTDATNVSAAGAPIISSGVGIPSSTPSKVGDIYIDTTGDDAYIATGTASSADWEKSNDGAGGGLSDGDKGDITVSGSGTVWTIDNDAVTNAKASDMAAYTLKLRNDAALGDPQDVKISALTAGTFGSGDKLIIEESTGELRQVDYDDLPGAGGGLSNIVEDITPQLGGSLDVNGNKIVSIANGNIDTEPNGTGNVLLGNFTFDADQTVGAGQDNFVLTYDNTSGLIALEAAAGGGNTWSDPVNADIIPDTDSTYDLGSPTAYFTDTHTDRLLLNATATLAGATAGEITATGHLNLTGQFTFTKTASSDFVINTNALVVDGSNNKIGVGIAVPISTLHFYENNTGTGSGNGITVEQDGTGDAIVQFLITGVRRWMTGVDNSDSDAFRISPSSNLSSHVLSLSTGGVLTLSNYTGASTRIAGLDSGGALTAIAPTGTYTPTNVTTDRAYDANSTTLDEIADVLGTLIADLQTQGVIG